jgi:hypothetical protein
MIIALAYPCYYYYFSSPPKSIAQRRVRRDYSSDFTDLDYLPNLSDDEPERTAGKERQERAAPKRTADLPAPESTDRLSKSVFLFFPAQIGSTGMAHLPCSQTRLTQTQTVICFSLPVVMNQRRMLPRDFLHLTQSGSQ